MRILVLTNYYPPHTIGSYELQCCQVCQELGHRGHQIHVLTSTIPPGTRNFPMPGRIARELVLYPEEEAPAPGFSQLYKVVRQNRALVQRFLEAVRPEVVMVWGMERLPCSLLNLLEASGTPVVYAVYDYWLAAAPEKDEWLSFWADNGMRTDSFSRTVLKGLRLDSLVQTQAPSGAIESLRLDRIFFCSESLKRETALASGRSLDHALTIPCAISTRGIRAKEGLPGINYRLLYVARLNEEKDPMTALKALQELRHRGDDRFSLDIFGRGKPEFEASLHDYVRKYQLGGAVSFKPMEEEQVRNTLHLYDALIFTSRYPEPFPLIHLKAMAARIPVISTLEGGSGELVRHGENGLAFETSNHYQLADTIAHLADDPGLGSELVANAYAEVTRHYGVERITSRIESLLHRAVNTEGTFEAAA